MPAIKTYNLKPAFEFFRDGYHEQARVIQQIRDAMKTPVSSDHKIAKIFDILAAFPQKETEGPEHA